MVRKLLKKDLKSILRLAIPLDIILLIIAILAKTGNTVVNSLILNRTGSYSDELPFLGGYYIAVIATFVITVVLIVRRFYRNFFSSEGYLTFTLPATTTQHIISKLISALITACIGLLTLFISSAIIDYEHSQIYYLIDNFIRFINYVKIYGLIDGIVNCNLTLDIINIFYILAYLINGFLIIYACIAIGQRFNKNRNIIATSIFVGYFIVTAIAKIAIWSSNFYYNYCDTSMITTPIQDLIEPIVGIIFKLIMAVIYFLILHNTIDKHLNLE